MSSIKQMSYALAVVASLASMSAWADSGDQFQNGESYFGQVAEAASVDRSVTLTAGAKLNVKYGETLQFVSSGKSFVWRFNGFDNRAVDLQRIAPSGFDAQNATIYIHKDPLNRW